MTLTELFSVPDSWMQLGSWGRRWYEGETRHLGPCNIIEANCFCFLGGIDRCYGNDAVKRNKIVCRTATILRPGSVPVGEHAECVITNWNDIPGRTFADVQELARKVEEE